MVQHTPLRKFRINFLAILVLLLSSQGLAEESAIPLIQNLGVIPTSMDNKGDDITFASQIQETADQLYGEYLKDSGRFTILDSDLIKTLWSSPIGRQELKEDHELHVFGNLLIDIQGDRLVLTSRLLDSELKVLLQESSTSFLGGVREAPQKKIEELVRGVIYKKLNRLPFDATVTSVHGAYVTISAGMNLGVENGDVLDVVNTMIATRHPANGAWLSFSSAKVGSLKVIDTKSTTSIGMLMMQTKKDSVRVGQGIKVKKSAQRQFYASQKKEEREDKAMPNSEGVIVVEPLYPKGEQKKVVSPKVGGDSSSREESGAVEETPAPKEDSDGNMLEDIGNKSMDAIGSVVTTTGDILGAITEKFADNLTVNVGQFGWWYTGPGATGTTVKWFLPVNKASAILTRQIMPNIKYGMGGGLAAGKSVQDITYTSYEGNVRVYWEAPFPASLGLPIRNWKAGADGSLSGLALSEGLFGGNDLIRGGIFGGLAGDLPSGISGTLIDWHAEMGIIPITIGRVGYRGSFKGIRSSFGWQFRAIANMRVAPNTIEWGGGFEVGGHNILDDSGRETGMSQFGLFGSARWRY